MGSASNSPGMAGAGKGNISAYCPYLLGIARTCLALPLIGGDRRLG